MKLRINHLFHNFLKINMYFWPDMKVLLHLLDKPLLKKKKRARHVTLDCHMAEFLHIICIIQVSYAGMWMCVYLDNIYTDIFDALVCLCTQGHVHRLACTYIVLTKFGEDTTK